MKIGMNNRKKDKTLKEGKKEFLRHCKVKNLSKKTVKYYKNSYNYLTKYLKEDTKLKKINKKVIEDFILYLKENHNLNNISINTRLRGIRALLYYCMDLGYLDEFKIEELKTKKKIKETYTDEELKILLEKPDINNCNFTEYRCWVIVNWVLATGNRARTIRNIQIKDLDFESGHVILRRTKNRKQQIIPLSNTLINILKEYLEYRGINKEDYLFCTKYGNKMKASTLKKSIYKYNKSRGVDKTSLHLFRHTFAKKWILSGGDIFRLKKLLGHSSMKMVKEYVNMYGDDLKKNFEKHNPLNQFSNNKNTIKME